MATANGTHKPIIFIFAGQGSQWHGMGQLSYAQNHVFRQTVDDLDRVLSGLGRIAPLWKLSGMWTILPDAFDGSKKASQLPTGASWSVTTTTALQLAQLHMLASMDSHPDYVLGHSFGEVPAAYACGMLELKEAITIAYRSSYVLEQMSGPGEMLVCDMDFATATKEVETLGLSETLRVACINSSSSTTIAGCVQSAETFKQHLLGQGSLVRRLRTCDVAYHSHLIDALARELESELACCLKKSDDKRKSTCTWISSVSPGEIPSGTEVYWYTNLSQVVLFKQAVASFVGLEPVFDAVEIGPHPTLERPFLQTVEECTGQIIGSQITYQAIERRGRGN